MGKECLSIHLSVLNAMTLGESLSPGILEWNLLARSQTHDIEDWGFQLPTLSPQRENGWLS